MVGNCSNEEKRRKVIDATVGGLVWVRRRNGCWWPGQIVGLDELAAGSSVSSRSGTPIKLLGRDDSSVDWYDLEKSKGVKAFRCGDYDDCIEKAKAYANSSKKVRYLRREDAIMHALEIEKTSLCKDPTDPHSIGDNPDGEPLLGCANGSASISQPSKDDECSSEETSSEETTSTDEDNSHSTQELSYSGITYEETNGAAYLKEHQYKGRKRKTPNDSEDDGSEGIKRMKGLDDLGIGGSVRKVQVLALANPFPQNGTSLSNLRATNSVSVAALTNGCSMPTLKKKRSQVVHIHELLKRKYRRRPLTKVLENSTMVPVRIICDEFATPFERSDAVSSCNGSEIGNKVKDGELFPEDNNSSDMLFDVPFVDEELHPSGVLPVWQPSSPFKSHVGAFRGNSSRNDLQGQASSSGHEVLREFVPDNQNMEKSASKWQSKGKRRARHVSKTEEPNSRDQEKSNAYVIGLEYPGGFSPSSNGLVNGFTDRRKHISLSSSSPRSFSYHHQPPPRFLVHASFEMPDSTTPRGGIYGDLPLYEVEITVEATRPQAQQVPYISLMSKLNGKPITGHPVTVEALEDGYCDLQISDYPASGSCELDDEDREMGFTAVEPKPKRIRIRPHYSRKRSRSSSKSRRHGSSSKKTRKLSSLTGPHKVNPEKSMVQTPSKGPTLACVPLKIVFSRINAALNGSTTRSAHRATVTLNNT